MDTCREMERLVRDLRDTESVLSLSTQRRRTLRRLDRLLEHLLTSDDDDPPLPSNETLLYLLLQPDSEAMVASLTDLVQQSTRLCWTQCELQCLLDHLLTTTNNAHSLLPLVTHICLTAGSLSLAEATLEQVLQKALATVPHMASDPSCWQWQVLYTAVALDDQQTVVVISYDYARALCDATLHVLEKHTNDDWSQVEPFVTLTIAVLEQASRPADWTALAHAFLECNNHNSTRDVLPVLLAHVDDPCVWLRMGLQCPHEVVVWDRLADASMVDSDVRQLVRAVGVATRDEHVREAIGSVLERCEGHNQDDDWDRWWWNHHHRKPAPTTTTMM